MEIPDSIKQIAERIRTQDNRMTADPMFHVQIKVRTVGMDSSYSDNTCWYDGANGILICSDDEDFKEPPKGDEWEEFGYVDTWETVQSCFTEQGAKDYWAANGHNHQGRSHKGEWRIYADTLFRNREMIEIRNFLKSL